MSQPIYLDYNATTPIDPAVAEAMLPFLSGGFGNASSGHRWGAEARRAVERARASVAALIGCRPEELVFTSGGSESNNTVIKGVAALRRERGRHLVTSAVEHPAVLEPCRALEASGYRLSVVPVDGRGRVDPGDVERALTDETILVSVMHANNEVGTLQPIAEIAALARERGILVHTDAAQSVGKVPVDVEALGVDFLSVAGHKLYAPKGVGALFVRSGLRLPSLIHGGSHESGRRAGTESNHDVVGLGRAAELAAERLAVSGRECRALRDRLHERLEDRLGPLRVNGDPAGGLPNTLSVCFRGVDASALLAEIGDRVAASAGAACHAEGVDVSTVLQAMGVPVDEAMGAVRFSVGRGTSAADVDAAAAIVADAVGRLGHAAPAAVASGADGEVRLTRFTHGMGCACKLRPQELEQVLRALPRATSPDLLVGTETSDDAAVFRLTPDLAVVQTVDFFTPICDDPREFGAISAANSLSDVYAMGAEPRFALSVVAFPTRRLPLRVLEQILEGAASVAAEAGIEIVGGHSVEDPEPKFGLAVTGVVHPDRILRNVGARPGDVLFLTKPIGSGVVATAAKQGLAPADVLGPALASMRRLNRSAADAIRKAGGATACTDVTGFGLLGHLREMAAGSGVDVELEVGRVPLLRGVRALAAAGAVPGGSRENLAHVSSWTTWGDGVSDLERLLLADAQTSGGLLVAVDAPRAAELEAELRSRDVVAARIGRVTGPGPGRIVCR